MTVADLRRRHVVVVGASIGGISAVDALRAEGFEGAITLIGAEPHGPYARPPLSKGVLDGSLLPESTLLPLPDSGVVLRTGVTAVSLDRQRRVIGLDDGDEVGYDGLVIATGARVRRLSELGHPGDPGPARGTAGPAGEFVLRTLDDAVRLRDGLRVAGSVIVVGGGFLGMEVASSARSLGLEVTVVDLQPPLVAALGPLLAGMFARAAAERGVRIRIGSGGAGTGPGGVRPLRDGDRIAGVEVDGTRLEADLVVTAIGDRPNVEWLSGSGIGAPGGIVVDDRCRVNDHVVAAGDVAIVPRGGVLRRLPFWSNAIAQAQSAARALLHGDDAEPYHPEPYYWTDAFGLAAKVAGDLPVDGEPEVLAGSLSERSALLRWTRGDLRAAAAVNHKVSQVRLRRLAAELSA